VNNAGIYEFAPLEGVTEESFHKHFNLNVLGLLLTTQEAVKLIGPEGGSVINVGSGVSTMLPAGTSVYTATKASVDAITGVLAKELGPRKIRVNALNPGMIETEGVRSAGFNEGDFRKWIESTGDRSKFGLSSTEIVMLVDRLTMLQISRVLAFAGDQGRTVIERDYAPLGQGRAPDDESKGAEAPPPVTQVLVHRGGPAVIQTIDVARLVAAAARHDATITMAWAVGDTLADGMPLLQVHGGSRPIAERALRSLVRLGAERTFQQDPKYAIRILVDIAIKALSPAVNDPTTAVQALDQVEDLLLRLARCSLSVGRARDRQGRLRLAFPVPSFEDLLVLALDEIRFYGASSIQVMRRMRALLNALGEQVPAERRPAVQRYVERVDKGIRRTFEDGEDRTDALEQDRQGLGLSRVRGPA
jgi:NAD(P)-dependent dehydrogenase (short-subunit alcohol dehydrogenase family)